MIQHPLQYVVNNKSLLTSIAQKYGTPFYLYSGDRIKNNLQHLSGALNDHFQKNYHQASQVVSLASDLDTDIHEM